MITIKVKRFCKSVNVPEIIKKGEWIDLQAAERITMQAPQSATLKSRKVGDSIVSTRDVSFSSRLIPLGVAMKLPEGYEAIILPRSSTFKKYNIILANSQGVIDNSYCGDKDQWMFPAIALGDVNINEGDRICQFRIQLSQKATIWQKIKWLFSSGINFVEVDSLEYNDRGGFGSTGV